MPMTRREMCLLIPALLPAAGALQALGQDKSLASGAFSFDKAPLHVANNNAQVRMMLRGKLATGEGIEVHQTTLPPGGAPVRSPRSVAPAAGRKGDDRPAVAFAA